jgi:uncharacterized repeat protein (TIGR03803 family)
MLLLVAGLGAGASSPATAQEYAPLVSFSPLTGTAPDSLVRGSDGLLYGVASHGGGGGTGSGTVFRFRADAPLEVLAIFPPAECDPCRHPAGRLTEGSDGFFYGVTRFANGAVFRISPEDRQLEVLHVFQGADGSMPNGGLIEGADGLFYGTTAAGGQFGMGTVFKVHPSGQFVPLHHFSGRDGAQPNGDLATGADGAFYGTTEAGGAGFGTLFRIDPHGAFESLHSFQDARHPAAGLVLAADGAFHGTTRAGGDAGLGTIFRFTMPGAELAIVHAFSGPDGADGAEPRAGLHQAVDGRVYGTTSRGGTSNLGTVYRLNAEGQVRVLHSFAGGVDGSEPGTSLAQGADGHVYGTVPNGGFSDDGLLFRVVQDIVPPETLITGAPEALTGSTTATFQFAATEAGSGFACSLDGAAFTACTSPATYDGLASGPHAFEVVAIDPEGNVDPTPARHEWTIDAVPPDTSITSAPAALTTSTSASFMFTSTKPGGTFWCSLDHEPLAPCTSPQDYVGLPVGVHTFEVAGADALGNGDPTPARYTWTIEVDTTITSGPPVLASVPTATFEFTATAPGTGFECRLDDGDFEPCTSPATYEGLAPGAHVFQVRAVAPGGVDDTPAEHAWTVVDEEAPDTIILAAPPERSESSTAVFEFASTEPGSTFECWLDAQPLDICVSPTELGRLAAGRHTFIVRAMDPSGNVDPTPATHTWTVVLLDTLITSAPAGTTNSTTASVAFSATEEGVAGFECRLDDGDFAPCASPAVYRALAPGPHAFAVRYVGSGGETDPSPATHAWTIELQPGEAFYDMVYAFGGAGDGTGPSSALVADGAGGYLGITAGGGEFGAGTVFRLDAGGGLTLLHSFGPATGATPEAPLVRGSDGQFYGTTSAGGQHGLGTVYRMSETGEVTVLHSFDGTTGATPVAGLVQGADGDYYGTTSAGGDHGSGTVYRMNAAGDVTPLHSFGATSGDGRRPRAPLVQGRDGAFYGTTYEGGLGAGTVYRMTADGTVAVLHAFDGGAGAFPLAALLEVRDGVFYGTTYGLPAVSFRGTVYEIARDGIARALVVFDNVADGPHHPAAGLIQGGDGRYYGTTTGGGGRGAGTVFAIDGAGTVVRVHGFDPAIGGAPRAALLRGQDGGMYGTASEGGPSGGGVVFRLVGDGVADTTPPDTAITEQPPAVTASTSASFTFVATEPDSTFECRLDGGDFSPCTAPKVYTLLADGSHTFDVRATDPAGNTDPTPASFTWVVETVDTTPPDTGITDAPPPATNATTASFSFVSTEPGSAFQCSLDGATFTACTSPWSYTRLKAGTHTFRVRAIDPAGNVDASPATHVWAIDTTAPNTSITAAPPKVTNDLEPLFSFTASEPAAAFQCSLDGSAFTACTSPLTWQGVEPGSHVFRVRALDAAGNVDPTPASHSWTIDVTPPETTITSAPPAETTKTSASFKFASSEKGSTFECRLDESPFTPCTSPTTYSGLTRGAHTFEVRAKDPAGNTDASPATATWIIQ